MRSDSPLAAVREVGYAGVAGLAGGIAWAALARHALDWQIPHGLLVAMFGVPVGLMVGWIALTWRRADTWDADLRWARVGMAVGILGIFVAIYAGWLIGMELTAAAFGPPVD